MIFREPSRMWRFLVKVGFGLLTLGAASEGDANPVLDENRSHSRPSLEGGKAEKDDREVADDDAEHRSKEDGVLPINEESWFSQNAVVVVLAVGQRA